MAVTIPVELQGFVHDVVGRGIYRDEGEVVSAALQLLRKREQLRHDVRAGIQQIHDGEHTDYDEAGLRSRFQQIMAEGRKRLADGQNAS